MSEGVGDTSKGLGGDEGTSAAGLIGDGVDVIGTLLKCVQFLLHDDPESVWVTYECGECFSTTVPNCKITHLPFLKG